MTSQQPCLSRAASRGSRPTLLLCLLLATFTLGLNAPPALALGNLLITPTRVTLEGRQRTAVVTLSNTGVEPATYRISLVRRRMTETGDLLDVTTPQPDERFADGMIRFSPSEVVLPPGLTQTIRLQLRKPSELAAGEYRSHLLIRAIPAPDVAGKNIESLGSSDGKVSVRMIPIIGFTIPLIVRQGETSAAAEIAQLRLLPASDPKKPPEIAFTIKRSGNRSVYGDLVASFKLANGKALALSRVNGVSVYVPNTLRQLQIPVQLPPGETLRHGQMRVEYQDPVTSATLARAELVVP